MMKAMRTRRTLTVAVLAFLALATFATAEVTPIRDIQGAGGASALAGQTVTARGVVTATKSNGFFLQTPDGEADSDPATPEGLFVYTSSEPPASAAAGTLIAVTGRVQDYRPSADPDTLPVTELVNPLTVTVLATGQPLPEPVTLTAADTDPAAPLTRLGRLAAMRVAVERLVVVAPTGGRIDEGSASATSDGVFFGVIEGLPRPRREAGVDILDPLPAGSPCCVPRFDGNPERLRVDSDGLPGAGAIDVASGATVSGLRGPLDFASRTWTILPEPASPPTITDAPAPGPAPRPGATTIAIASCNLERFFDALADPGTPTLTPDAFERRLAKASLLVRTVLGNPAIVAVQEVENLATLQALAARINGDGAGDSPRRDYAAFLEEGNDSGGIDVGVLIDRTRVSLANVAQFGKTTPFSWDGTPLNDRPPLVVRATALSSGGANLPLVVVINHLRSLTGIDDPAKGPRVRAKRQEQAEFLAGLLHSLQSERPGVGVLAVGDFNAFEFSDGFADVIGTACGHPAPADQVVIATSRDLVNPDLVDLATWLPPEARWSYVYGGNAQLLDHALASSALLVRVAAVVYPHVNADAPEALRNRADTASRLSDHDPLLVILRTDPMVRRHLRTQ